jgi:hypothetical protein
MFAVVHSALGCRHAGQILAGPQLRRKIFS